MDVIENFIMKKQIIFTASILLLFAACSKNEKEKIDQPIILEREPVLKNSEVQKSEIEIEAEVEIEDKRNVASLFNQKIVFIESRDVITQLSEGMDFEILANEQNKRFYRMTLYSSFGKTIYTCVNYEDDNCWYLEKRAIFYDEPFEAENAEEKVSYFMYDGACYKLNGKFFEKGIEVNQEPAVVDFRTADSIIEMVEAESKE